MSYEAICCPTKAYREYDIRRELHTYSLWRQFCMNTPPSLDLLAPYLRIRLLSPQIRRCGRRPVLRSVSKLHIVPDSPSSTCPKPGRVCRLALLHMLTRLLRQYAC